MRIVVTYRSIDRYYKRREFKTLEGARKFAWRWVGENPEVSWTSGYAVSGDGVGKVEVSGDASILDLYPRVATEMAEVAREVAEEDSEPGACEECGRPGDYYEGLCYECQCTLHAMGAFDMDGRGWVV